MSHVISSTAGFPHKYSQQVKTKPKAIEVPQMKAPQVSRNPYTQS